MLVPERPVLVPERCAGGGALGRCRAALCRRGGCRSILNKQPANRLKFLLRPRLGPVFVWRREPC